MFVHCTPHCIDLTDTDLTARVFFGSASFIYFILLLLLLALCIMYISTDSERLLYTTRQPVSCYHNCDQFDMLQLYYIRRWRVSVHSRRSSKSHSTDPDNAWTTVNSIDSDGRNLHMTAICLYHIFMFVNRDAQMKPLRN